MQRCAVAGRCFNVPGMMLISISIIRRKRIFVKEATCSRIVDLFAWCLEVCEVGAVGVLNMSHHSPSASIDDRDLEIAHEAVTPIEAEDSFDQPNDVLIETSGAEDRDHRSSDDSGGRKMIRVVSFPPKARDLTGRERFIVFVNCYFITIATILGTGILGLPVKLYESGFSPFIVMFALCFLAQSAIVFYMVELLQRTQTLMEVKKFQQANSTRSLRRDSDTHASSDNEAFDVEEADQFLYEKTEDDSQLALRTGELSDVRGDEDAAELPVSTSTGGKKKKRKVKVALSQGPDLHTMGTMFLGRWNRKLFDVAVILHFVAILISYALAGSKAYGKLLGMFSDFMYIIPFFVIGYTAAVLIMGHRIQPYISIFTLCKGSLLVVMIAIVGLVGSRDSSDDVNVESSWGKIGDSFLIGTVALGGVINILPVLYARIPPTRNNVLLFRRAVMWSLATCWTLNVLWCMFVLQIVPQHEPSNVTIDCDDEHTDISLEAAQKCGNDATQPLVEILNVDHPGYAWVSTLVTVFMAISITVSFVTMSSGLKHMLDGYVKSFQEKSPSTSRFKTYLMMKLPTKWKADVVFQWMLYVSFYGSILIVALSNPSQFLIVLEYPTSLALNAESGVFISIMIIAARKQFAEAQSKARDLHAEEPNAPVLPDVPVPTAGFIWKMRWVIAGYFLIAIGWDVVDFILEVIV